MTEKISFPSGNVNYYYNSSFDAIREQYGDRELFFITDSNIAHLYPNLLTAQKHLILRAGEQSKSLETIQQVISSLISAEVSRKGILIGIGGGAITDITGFVASVYMRGIDCGFVPTTLLAMVDASIGGKNGVNIGLHKNMAGTITQPAFILFDANFLHTLPDEEWSNGFAEVIKYACLFDEPLFNELEQHNITYYKENATALQQLTNRCVAWKNKTVLEDENETGNRKLLNFGHTAAHAIENLCEIAHGKAVAVGMVIACIISEEINGMDRGITTRLKSILFKYGLPVSYPFEAEKAMEILKMDKKRDGQTINYILLKNIATPTITPLSFKTLETAIYSCAQ